MRNHCGHDEESSRTSIDFNRPLNEAKVEEIASVEGSEVFWLYSIKSFPFHLEKRYPPSRDTLLSSNLQTKSIYYIRRPRLKEGERARDYRCGSLALLRLSTNLQATDASTARCCSNTCITGAATYCASSSQHEPAGNRRFHCSMLLEHMHQWNRKLQQRTNPSGGGSQCRGRAP